MKPLFLIIILLLTSQSNAQRDSLAILHTNTWTIKKQNPYILRNWLEQDTISLISTNPIKKIKDSLYKKNGLTEAELKFLISNVRDKQELINFDSIGKLHHIKYIFCPVGSTLFHLKSFSLENNVVNLIYTKKEWKKTPAEKFSVYYKVLLWDDKQIQLRKIKE
ncbi:hypothetical protein [uncultured Winogradskyella sp.]|uniref:hypothetical protein n=1 Tax=Winogradskyella sp. 4-2091 TaxID=3381659 RepID=UPI00260EEB66|nr:hypothetical protein [uncultured Winogradskyella sp.]